MIRIDSRRLASFIGVPNNIGIGIAERVRIDLPRSVRITRCSEAAHQHNYPARLSDGNLRRRWRTGLLIVEPLRKCIDHTNRVRGRIQFNEIVSNKCSRTGRPRRSRRKRSSARIEKDIKQGSPFVRTETFQSLIGSGYESGARPQ